MALTTSSPYPGSVHFTKKIEALPRDPERTWAISMGMNSRPPLFTTKATTRSGFHAVNS